MPRQTLVAGRGRLRVVAQHRGYRAGAQYEATLDVGRGVDPVRNPPFEQAVDATDEGVGSAGDHVDLLGRNRRRKTYHTAARLIGRGAAWVARGRGPVV